MSFKIFINYRRLDSSWPAQLIYNYLVNKYDSSIAFKDLDINPGENFEKRIDKELSGCRIFISVINKNWVAELEKRVNSDVDYVVTEIKVALENNKHIIPVLIDDTNMPFLEQVPDSIKLFCKKNSISIVLNNLNTGLERLFNTVNELLKNDAPSKNVLVLDESAEKGGFTLGMLYNLEKRLNRDCAQFQPLASYFDLIISTGPSSFISVLLSLGKSIPEIGELYTGYIRSLYGVKNMWWSIFDFNSFLLGQYKSKSGLKFLNDIFKDIKIDDKSFKSNFGVFSYNIDEEELYFFSNLKTDYFEREKNLFVKDILMCSSIYPTYHQPYSINLKKDTNFRFVTGSIGTTPNPTLNAAFFIQSQTDSLQWNLNPDQLFFLSVGKGKYLMKRLKYEKNIRLWKWVSALPGLMQKNYTANNETLFTIISKGFNPDSDSYNDFQKIVKANLNVDSLLFSAARLNVELDNHFSQEKLMEDNYTNTFGFYQWSRENTSHLIENIPLSRLLK